MQKLKLEVVWVAVDVTGYMLTQASHYYLTRNGRRMKHFWQGFYAVDLDTQYILTWCEGIGPASDARFLDRLRRRIAPYARRVGRRWEYALLADKGFDGTQTRSTDFIAPKQGTQRARRIDRKQRADLTDMARLDGIMGRRWLIETVMSVIKRKSGDAIRSRRFMRQRPEIAVKAIVYNLHRRRRLWTSQQSY